MEKQKRIRELMAEHARQDENKRTLKYNSNGYNPNHYYVMEDGKYIPKSKYNKGWGQVNWSNFPRTYATYNSSPTLSTSTEIEYPEITEPLKKIKFQA